MMRDASATKTATSRFTEVELQSAGLEKEHQVRSRNRSLLWFSFTFTHEFVLQDQTVDAGNNCDILRHLKENVQCK